MVNSLDLFRHFFRHFSCLAISCFGIIFIWAVIQEQSEAELIFTVLTPAPLKLIFQLIPLSLV